MEAYEQFEREKLQAELEEFAFKNGLDLSVVKELFSEYVFSGKVQDEDVRQRLMPLGFGLLKTTKLTKTIREFVEFTYKKFRAEGH